jgi:hypothetical protein
MPAYTIEIRGVPGECPYCQHAPIRHVRDGTGYSCLVCLFLAEQAVMDAAAGRPAFPPPGGVCTVGFQFKLSQREREQAASADKGSWPPRQVCAACFCEWQQHEGYLCPTGDSTFVPLLDKDQPFLRTH